MKPKLLSLLAALLFTIPLFAQETVAYKSDYAPDVIIKYNVLKSDNKTLEGLYQAFYRKKTVVASGRYDHGKRVGIWHFYDKKGTPIQQFNYDSNSVMFEAGLDSLSIFKFILDDNITKNDTVTVPVRLGGRFFGYLPYLNLFRLPQDLVRLTEDDLTVWPTVYIELLVSPMGRLADYKVHVVSPAYGERIFEVNIDQLNTQSKSFVPATLNGKSVSSRIILLCGLTNNRHLVI